MKCVLVSTAAMLVACGVAQPSTTSRINFSSSGQQIASGISNFAINADARYCAFSSADPNIIQGDTNGVADVFVRDTQTGEVRRVSISSAGVQANGASHSPSMSSGGRYIAFVSSANNLVVGDSNGVEDIFLHDAQTGVTICVSLTTSGQPANGPSSDPFVSATGRYVAFASEASNLAIDDNNGVSDVYVRDCHALVTECASRANGTNVVGNGPSRSPSIDATGTFVVFSSVATNLIPLDTNGMEDVFARIYGGTGLVSRTTNWVQGNGPSYDASIAPDGSYIVYASEATNFYAGDTNGVADLFLFDMVVFETEHARISSIGNEPNGGSWSPSLSFGGRQIAFISSASNLVVNDKNGAPDVFVFDRVSGKTSIASKSSLGAVANSGSRSAQISAHGRVAFITDASNLIPFDTNDADDVFLHDIFSVRPTTVNVSRGHLLVGNLPAIVYADDNSHLVIRPGATLTTMQQPIVVEFESEVIRTTPTSLTASVRSRASAASIRQTIEWYDFVNHRYAEVDERPCSLGFTDTTVSVGFEQAARFISPSGTVMMRVSFRPAGPVLAFPWQVGIDQIRWWIYE